MVSLSLWLFATCPPLDAQVSGDRWTSEAEAAFRAELQVETTRAGRCLDAGAQVRLTWQGEEPVSVSVSWQVGPTERVLRRSVDPRTVPPDGLMLGLAAVVSELLGEVESFPVVEASAPPAVEAPRSKALLARLAGALYGSGTTFAGGAVALRFAWPSRWELEFSVAGRGALSRDSALGGVNLASLGGGVGLGFRALERGGVSLVPFGQLEAGWVWALPTAGVDARGQQTGGVFVTARAGLELAFRPGAVWWAVALSVGAPLRGVAFTDGTSTVSAVSGVEGGLTVSAGPAW